MYLPVNTQFAVLIPVVDDTNYVTPETGFVHANFTASISKNGSTFGAFSPAENITHTSRGFYRVVVSAAENNTPGIMTIMLEASGGFGAIQLEIGGTLDQLLTYATQASTNLATIVTSLSGIDTVTITQPVVGNLLTLVQGQAYDGGIEPRLTFRVTSAIPLTSGTGMLTIRDIDDYTLNAPLLELTATQISAVGGDEYDIEFELDKFTSQSLEANLTLVKQTLEDRVDGWENEVRWNAVFDKKFSVVVENASGARKEFRSGICLVQESQTEAMAAGAPAGVISIIVDGGNLLALDGGNTVIADDPV